MGDNLRQLEDPADNTRLSGIGHKLYGIAATAGLLKLANLSRQMERAAKAKDPAAGSMVPDVLSELDYCNTLVKATLHTIRSK